jgi:glycosyltransferase involved in cell wall biosynthesis
MQCAEKPLVSFVIPVRNEGPRLLATVASIVQGRSSPFPIQIVLVDDASSDGCCDALPSACPWRNHRVQVKVIRLDRWSGIPYARNCGAGAAEADILFITDANVQFPSRWDLPIRTRIAQNRALCATIADADSPFRGYGGTLHLPSMGFDWLRTPNAFSGYVPISPCTGTVLPTTLFRKIGGYDTAMPMYGAAEPEFSVRLWLSGAEIVLAPELVLRHRFRPSSERMPFLEAISAIQTHNYLRFGLLYLERPQLLRLLHHYAASAPRYFEKSIRRLWAGDVWARRDLLRRTLPGRFEAFIERFALQRSRKNSATSKRRVSVS